MKIFFTTSFSGRDKYQKNTDMIVQYLDSIEGLELITTERDAYLDIINKRRKKKIVNLKLIPFDSKDNLRIHYNAVKLSIIEADAVIMDNSNESFRLGHEATIAVQMHKPTLVMSVHRDLSKFIRDPLFFGAKYTRYNYKTIIKEFLEQADRKMLSVRFNMFISKEQEEFLRKQAAIENSTKSGYLRDLIEEDMNS